jgi:hypothetical protein
MESPAATRISARTLGDPMLTPTKKSYEALGHQLMRILAQAFPETRTVDAASGEYERLNLAEGFNVRFHQWARRKPYYIILYLKNKYLFEIDLSRIVEQQGRFTWYFNRPTHAANQQFLSSRLIWEEVPSVYLDAVRQIKTRLLAGQVVAKAGYRLCKQSSRKTLESNFVEILQRAVATHQKDIEYDFDDPRAIEGYEQDRIITTHSRNRLLVEQCKQRDNNTCRACAFCLLVHGQYVIECHHVNPLSQNGERLSSIDELVCLCPTCHRIAHKRSKPFSVVEIKKLIRHETGT